MSSLIIGSVDVPRITGSVILAPPGTVPEVTSSLLLETGDAFLLETGDLLLLEA